MATGAGRLKAKYVIHAPTMEKPAMRIDEGNVQLAIRGSLKCAEQLGIRSIAFPGMGTGMEDLDLEEAAGIMVREIKGHIDERTSLKQITLVGFTDDLAQAFKRALNRPMYMK